jgi:hypothetical protein
VDKEKRSSSKSKSKTRAKSPASTNSHGSYKTKVINPYDLLKRTSNPYVDQKIINDYVYTRDIEKLKKLMKNLDEEIRVSFLKLNFLIIIFFNFEFFKL